MGDKDVTLTFEKNAEMMPMPRSRLEKYPKLEVYATFIAASTFLCVGLLRAYPSLALASMKQEPGLLNSTALPEKELIAWIASSTPGGAFIGTLVAGPLLQICGRQKTLLMLTIPFIGGWIFLGFAKGIYMILAGRILTGFAAGIATPACQLYISECVRAKVRGTLGFLPSMLLALGVLLGFAAGTIRLEWREFAILLGTCPVILFFAMLTIPESPGWLLLRNREPEALKSLKSLRSGTEDDIRTELDGISAVLPAKSLNSDGALIQKFSKREIWFPALISIGLMIFQQFCGPNCVIYYVTFILEDSLPITSAVDKENYLKPYIGALIVGGVQFVAFFVSLPLIDSSGRKVLLYVSGILMAAAHGMMGIYFYALNQGLQIELIAGLSHWFPIFCLSLFIAAYSIGFGPIPFLIMSEIFPSHARSYLCSIASFVNHLTVFVTIYIFPTLMSEILPHWTFWMLGSFAAISVLFTCVFVPETKGKTLAEIELEFRRHKILSTKL